MVKLRARCLLVGKVFKASHLICKERGLKLAFYYRNIPSHRLCPYYVSDSTYEKYKPDTILNVKDDVCWVYFIM